MSDFWERQRAKRQTANPPASEPAPSRAWWAEGTNLLPQTQTVPQQPAQSQQDGNLIDGHDVSKAEILRGRAEECPMCPPDPSTGIRGNMYRPSPNAAMRCFDCGYIDGNRFEGTTRGMSAVSDGGPSHKARQVPSGGGIVHNNRGNIKSAQEAVGRVN